jgi:hypothetical protein
MGLEWSLVPVDPDRPEDTAGEAFVPFFSPLDLDRILVGRDEGPVLELFNSGEPWPGYDGPPEDCPSYLIPPPDVRRCAARLAGVDRSAYAPPVIALADQCYDRQVPGLDRLLDEDLAAEADALRRFVARAADLGLALRCWMH